MSIEAWLCTEIEDEFEKVSKMKPGSEEHRIAVDSLTKLMDRAIEMNKVENDCEDKKNDARLKAQQLEDEKKSRLVQNIISAVGIVLPLAVTIWGTKVSLKFEEEGTVTTQMGRGFIQRLFPKK